MHNIPTKKVALNTGNNIGPVRVIAITGGKGGVGKTNVAINLSICLAMLNYKVMLLDADLGLANIDILLGLSSRYNLSHVINGQCKLEDIIIEGPENIKILPSASGCQEMASLNTIEQAGIIQAFSQLGLELDFLIVDTTPGISASVINFIKASREIVMVVCNEPTSITDAYVLMKHLNDNCEVNRFHILANMTKKISEGEKIYQNLIKLTDNLYNMSLDYIGEIPYDEALRRAVQNRKSVIKAYPNSKASKAFIRIAENIEKLPKPNSLAGHMEFFIERLIQGQQMEHRT